MENLINILSKDFRDLIITNYYDYHIGDNRREEEIYQGNIEEIPKQFVRERRNTYESKKNSATRREKKDCTTYNYPEHFVVCKNGFFY